MLIPAIRLNRLGLGSLLLIVRRNPPPAALERLLTHRSRFEGTLEKPFPDLALALRTRADQIIQAWIEEIRKAIPLLRNFSDIELRDNMPNIVAGMADYLAAANGARKLVAESPLQGVSRFNQKYDMRALMHEDRLFRRIVIEQCELELGRRMSQEEQIALDTGVDVMLQQAVVAFVEQQSERLRSGAETELKYLSFLSHDLNNNLGSVTLFLQVLRQRLADFPEFAGEVVTLDQAQASIVNTISGMERLLQNERLRKAGVVIKAAPVQLNRLASNVVQQAMRQAERKQLRLTVDIPPSAVVNSDGELITLVLQNLLGNAVKYCKKGEIRISAAQQKDGNGDRWVLAVSDQGPGIAREHVERIFEAFNRGDSHGETGVGLGLAIASQAAKLLGAELTVESEVGAGSTFRLIMSNGTGDANRD